MKRGYFPVAMAVLALFLFLFLFPERMTAFRRVVLETQLSGMITTLGPRLLLVLAVVAVTILFGRLYCAFLCPAGLLQHLFTHIGKRLGIARLKYRRPFPALSVAVIAFVILFIVLLGRSSLVGPVPGFGVLVQPFGEIFRHGLHRAWQLLADNPTHAAAVAALFALMVVLPLFAGRVFCNRLCPVGILLGWAAALPGRRFRIDPDRCVSCGRCARACPVGCVDVPNKRIEADRCVECRDCVNACAPAAIAKTPPTGKTSRDRRTFVWKALTAVLGGLFVFSRNLTRPGGLIGTAVAGEAPVVPAGSHGNDRHRLRCIGCQACVPTCPVSIIRPRKGRPVLDYRYGYCQYNCQSCSDSCPAGAITHVDPEEKHVTRIARVSLDIEHCVVLTQGHHCGACAEVCPTHAVSMVHSGSDLSAPTFPDFDPDYCIGCGGCYHVCPAHPRAFSLEGLAVHERTKGVRVLENAHDEEPGPPPEPGELTDFPF